MENVTTRFVYRTSVIRSVRVKGTGTVVDTCVHVCNLPYQTRKGLFRI